MYGLVDNFSNGCESKHDEIISGSISAGRYSSLVSSIPRHTDPYYAATVDSLRYALDDLELQEAKRRARRR